MASSISVSIVTYNSEQYAARCIGAILSQDYPALEVVVVDNCSTDRTLETLRPFGNRIRVIRNARNIGFAAAQNQGIRETRGDWVLVLNPDVLVRRGFLRALAEAGEIDPRVGTVCGKLMRIGHGFTPLTQPILDSTGLYFTPNLRHFDRGSEEADQGQYSEPVYIFGASAAAALYRREMVEDVAIDGEFFDEDFFSYREDADLAWRAQLLGWRCLYTPEAVASHVRGVRPNSRHRTAPVLNMHSVKNRFLMRVKNVTPGVYLRHFLPITTRDVVVMGGCLLAEPTSLPAFWRFLGCLPRALRRRKQILGRRRVSDAEIAAWFGPVPSAQPAPALAEAPASLWPRVRTKTAGLNPA